MMNQKKSYFEKIKILAGKRSADLKRSLYKWSILNLSFFCCQLFCFFHLFSGCDIIFSLIKSGAFSILITYAVAIFMYVFLMTGIESDSCYEIMKDRDKSLEVYKFLFGFDLKRMFSGFYGI